MQFAFLRIIFLVVLGSFFASTAHAETKEIVILHTNDIESVYEPIEAYWRDDIEMIGGIPYLATLISETRAKESISFLMDAGDIYTGALSKKSKGKLPFDLYSAMGYDVLTIGNHEFEYGWKSLVETMPRASFPVLNANIVYEASGSLFARPYAILEREGIKVGVIGVMGIDAFYNTIAKFQRVGLTIKDPISTAQYWVDKIRDDVHVVVVLTHQNKTAPMQTNKEADPSVQRGFDEDYAMAGQLRGVDAIFGGHSDNGLIEPVVHPETGTVIGITFGQGMHLGYTRFKVDTQTHDVTFLGGKLIPVDATNLSADKQTTSLIEQQRQLHPAVNEKVAVLTSAAVRKYNKESNIGNLLTDYMRQGSNSDIAFLNSGAIRADLNTGPVTIEHLINTYPFVDHLTVVELTGKQVRQLIEYSLTLPYGIGQVSGLEIEYDSLQPAMQRLRSIKHQGEELNDTQKYTVSTTAFVANGGDGYQVFTEGKVVDNKQLVADILYSEFKKAGRIVPPGLGRLVDVNILD
jgi:2',3'-cyclic-nucleotide 2'-phosphodiesterase (5'-nucleotidase family)